MMVTVQYKNTFADLLWFHAHAFSRSPVMLAIFALLAAEACFIAYTSVPASTTLGVRIVVFVVMVTIIMSLFFLGFSVFIVLSLISKANKTILTQHTITLAETGLIEETEFNRTEMKWGGIQRIGRTRRHIFAYVSQWAAHVIPRRAFADDAAWESFHEELQSRVQRNG